jgi:glycosyltransferase involved in cell wall biosynthesis
MPNDKTTSTGVARANRNGLAAASRAVGSAIDMTIYCDARWLGNHGIGRFAANVFSRCPEMRALRLSGHPSAPLDSLHLAMALSTLPPDMVFFSPGYNSPLFAPMPFVFTVHDLNHIDRPENSSPAKRLYYALVLKRACRRAARVLTVSEFSRRRIVAWSKVPPEKVINVGNGVDAAYRPDAPPRATGYPYLLCVSNRQGHKNEPRLVEAFARSALPPALRLVFTGSATPELRAHIVRCGVAARVQFVGQVPEGEMPSLYRGAMALVFPSLYEGFGLPVVEAMACGTPVLTSNATALREIAGDAALLVNPESVDEIAAAIHRLASDAVLRRTLGNQGLAHASRFTWERTARKVRQVLETASGVPSKRRFCAWEAGETCLNASPPAMLAGFGQDEKLHEGLHE